MTVEETQRQGVDTGFLTRLSPAGLLPVGEFVEDGSESLGVMSSISLEKENIGRWRGTALAVSKGEGRGL